MSQAPRNPEGKYFQGSDQPKDLVIGGEFAKKIEAHKRSDVLGHQAGMSEEHVDVSSDDVRRDIERTAGIEIEPEATFGPLNQPGGEPQEFVPSGVAESQETIPTV